MCAWSMLSICSAFSSGSGSHSLKSGSVIWVESDGGGDVAAADDERDDNDDGDEDDTNSGYLLASYS